MIKNTAPIQMQSVINFMGCLGFVPDRTRKNGSFRNEGQLKRVANRHVSFETAVRLHNSAIDKWVIMEGTALFPELKLATGFLPLNVVMAHASKLVAKCKVRFDKHGNVVLADNANLVRAVNGVIASLVEAEIPAQ